MIVIVKGCDSVEIIAVKGKNQSKHFVKTAGQLYKMYPDALTRCHFVREYWTLFSEAKGSDEVIVYDENARWPHFPVPGVAYDQESVLRDIDEHKITGAGGLFRIKPYVKAAKDIRGIILAVGAPLLAGVIILWAVISG